MDLNECYDSCNYFLYKTKRTNLVLNLTFMNCLIFSCSLNELKSYSFLKLQYPLYILTCKGVENGLFILGAGLDPCRRLLIGGAPPFSFPLIPESNLKDPID